MITNEYIYEILKYENTSNNLAILKVQQVSRLSQTFLNDRICPMDDTQRFTQKIHTLLQGCQAMYHLQKKAFANRPNLISEPIKKLLPRYLVMSHIEVKKIY